MEEINIITKPEPPLTILTWLIGLRPALPYSTERPCTPVSNTELRRWILNGSILLNGNKFKFDDLMDFEVTSLVFFPKSPKRRTTLV